MEFWKTKQFRTLLKTWNQRLDETGFEDAEIELRHERALKQRASNSYRQASQLERETRLDYYLFLGKLVSEATFTNNLEKMVMHKHAEGSSIQEITRFIELNGISRDRKTIRHIIRRYQMRWGIRKWSLKQMKLKTIIKL